MGLDFYGFTNTVLVDTADNHDDYEEKYGATNHVFVSPFFCSGGWDFPEHVEGLVAGGVYSYAGEIHGYIGYHGHKFFREMLSGISGHSIEEFWQDNSGLEDEPFYWLINHSDCEGFINTAKSQILLIDFDSHKCPVDNWQRTYNSWREAFAFAANNGFVKFA